MELTRQERISRLNKKDPLRIDTKSLEEKLIEFADTLKDGVEINNLDDLLDQLALIQSFQHEVAELKEAIKTLKLPNNLQVQGIAELSKAIKKIKKSPDIVVEKIDVKPIVDGLDQLIDKIEKQKVEPGQKPSDFIPMRRVVLVNKQLMYDDSFYTGGGGGGGGPAVPDILFQPIAQTIAGTTSLIGGRVGKRIKVTSYAVVMGGAGTVKFTSDGNDITGEMSFAANGGVSVGGTEFSPAFQTGTGESLSIVTTSNAGNGHISYYFA